MYIPKVLIPVELPDGSYEAFEFDPGQIDWPELRTLWAEYAIHFPLCFAPPETKSDIFFYYACQKYGAPASLGSVYNPGWTDLFLTEVKHDCLIITDTLVPYITSHRLFANVIDQLHLFVCIGRLEPSQEARMQTLYPNLTCKTLPHPMTRLCG